MQIHVQLIGLLIALEPWLLSGDGGMTWRTQHMMYLFRTLCGTLLGLRGLATLDTTQVYQIESTTDTWMPESQIREEYTDVLADDRGSFRVYRNSAALLL